MDRRQKLEALAKKKREAAAAAAEKQSSSSSKSAQANRKRPAPSNSEPKRSSNLPNRPAPPKKPSAIPGSSGGRVYHRENRQRETPSPPRGRFGQNEDDYDEGDGFVVGSEEEEEEEDDDDISSEEDTRSKRKKVAQKGDKKSSSSKKKKKSRYSDSEAESEESMTLKDELDDLDTTNIIEHGPGIRTRSSRY